jgi:hypothetical protein
MKSNNRQEIGGLERKVTKNRRKRRKPHQRDKILEYSGGEQHEVPSLGRKTN